MRWCGVRPHPWPDLKTGAVARLAGCGIFVKRQLPTWSESGRSKERLAARHGVRPQEVAYLYGAQCGDTPAGPRGRRAKCKLEMWPLRPSKQRPACRHEMHQHDKIDMMFWVPNSPPASPIGGRTERPTGLPAVCERDEIKCCMNHGPHLRRLLVYSRSARFPLVILACVQCRDPDACSEENRKRRGQKAVCDGVLRGGSGLVVAVVMDETGEGPMAVSRGMRSRPRRRLLREHVLDLLVAQQDLVHGFSPVLERGVFAVDVGREEDLCRGAVRVRAGLCLCLCLGGPC